MRNCHAYEAPMLQFRGVTLRPTLGRAGRGHALLVPVIHGV